MTKITNSILQGLIKFGTAFSPLTKIGQYAVIAGGAFLIFSLGNCSGKTELDNFIVEYEEFKKNAEETTEYAESLKSHVLTLQDSVAQTETTVKKLKIEIVFNSKARERLKSERTQIQTELAQVTSIQDTVTVQEKIISNLETQLTVADNTITSQNEVISLRDQQLTQMQLAANLAVQRGDSLQTILTNIPKTPKNPDRWIFGIPKPSRTTVAIVSILTGIVVGAQLTK